MTNTQILFSLKTQWPRVTAEGVEAMKPGYGDFYVYKHKIIDHEFSVEKPLFEVNYTEQLCYLY